VKSRIYTGVLRHRRATPREHRFEYRVAMPYLCLDELPGLFDGTPLWSCGRWAPATFRREDFLGDAAETLPEAVRRRIREETGNEHTGPVYLLANLRYFGYVMNPIACYYCYSEDESRLEYLVAEVNNTPWDERHSYVLPAPASGDWLETSFAKAFHVSPFNPMDMRYRWRSNTPGEKLVLHMENWREDARVFDATLSMQGAPATAANLNAMLLRYPFMTLRTVSAIYWQALRLYFKGVPFHAHPDKQSTDISIHRS
jgi:DUF1365 family protein